MIRIAFRHIDSQAWQGGANYLDSLCRLLHKHFPDAIEPVMFHGPSISNEDRQRLTDLLGDRLVEDIAFESAMLAKRRWRSLVIGRDEVTTKLFRQHNIQVVFENADYYGWRFPFPTLAWAPDFQHRFFPHLFSKKQYWRREIGFRLQFRSNRQIVVSSQDAANHCKEFYKCDDDQISIVRFSVPADRKSFCGDHSGVIEKYELPTRFFLLPNQFWNHKNHLLVVRALAQLKDNGECPVVAVTGDASHQACFENYEAVVSLVRELGLESHFRLLGRIPFEDLNALLNSCIALLNPSLFEGWSTTIEEAKSFAVPLVLSDLDVHHEQAGGFAKFFGCQSAGELAETLRSVMKTEPDAKPDFETVAAAAENRQLEFASAFRAAVSASLDRFDRAAGHLAK